MKRRNSPKNSFISSLGGGHWLRFGLIGVDWSVGVMQFEFVIIPVQLRLTEGEFPILIKHMNIVSSLKVSLLFCTCHVRCLVYEFTINENHLQ